MHGDKELRSKVKLIGSALGEILKKQSHESVFDVVEELRTGHIELRKEHNSALNLSLRRRQPYLDSLVHVQLTLLKRYRNEALTNEEQDIWLSPLLRSINAIAGGMRNTG